MSMVSEICAEAHIKIVRAAVAKAMAKAKTEEARKLLSEVLKACEANIVD
jgi:hypothetical protein